MGVYNEDSVKALSEYIDASDKNAKEPDETWAAGFRVVQDKLDKLRPFFTQKEIEAIISEKDKIRAVLQEEVGYEREKREYA